MIIIGDMVIDPAYTRVIISRSSISADIAYHAKNVPGTITPDMSFIIPPWGFFWIDEMIQQGEYVRIKAYDPLAYYCKHRVTQEFSIGKDSWQANGKSLILMYNYISEQCVPEHLRNMRINLIRPDDATQGGEIAIDARYDTVFDIYSKIPDYYDSAARLRIEPQSASGYTSYKPELGNSVVCRIDAPYVIDYANTAAYAHKTTVLGKGTGSTRPKIVVGNADERLENITNAPFTENAGMLRIEGENALSAAEMAAKNITIRLLASDVPSGLRPANSIEIANGTYTVYNIEYTSSSRGDIAYISCGGKVMTISDRINAIVAADYAARY